GFGTACAAPLLNGSKFLSSDADTPLSAGYHLQDGSIVFLDGAYRNDVCGQYSRQDAQGKFDLEQPLSIYPYMWKQAAQTIAKYPLLGTGADNYIYAQLRSSYTIIQNLNIVDDPYNDYLYQAATRGIPALLLYLALAAVSLLRGAKAYRKGKAPLGLAVLLGAGGYLLTAVCDISALPVTPVFWMLLGLSCGGVQED
ncbi:O-antigen ligase family protein, partial [Ruminococcus sp. CAG:379]|uniref:O-antigen ligase family protein n=1 Tax=Ruminococcus sp. CAG:379 TaxID=1262956 RepID=UPI002585ECB0